MFGGYGLYCEGFFFALINREGELYLKVDDSNRALYEDAGSHKFHPDPEDKGMDYWLIPEAVFADPVALADWAARSLRIARFKKEATGSALAKMRGLGAKSAAWLMAAGITTPEQLQHAGPVASYRAVQALGYQAGLNLLWAIEGALTGLAWNRLPAARKEELIRELESA